MSEMYKAYLAPHPDCIVVHEGFPPQECVFCTALRACEQRTLERVREAVERLHKPWARAYMDTEVLAAIDALKQP